LSLEFANTADWHASHQPVERLHSYGDLVRWAGQNHVFSPAEIQSLLAQAEVRPDQAAGVLSGAIDLREAIYGIFSATAAGQTPTDGDLIILNKALPEALRHLQVAQVEPGFTWTWPVDTQALEAMLWPVAHSAAALLTSDLLNRVKECPDDRGCGFLFLDMSKNNSRRWCRMESCGNRAKVRRFRKRQGDEVEDEVAPARPG
jgi:predicted RNA-binding Zn ribbon-like protein